MRPIPNLSDQPSAELVKHLTTPNGTLRDLIHRDLIFRGDTNAIPHLQQTFLGRKEATARLYALCILDALGEVHEDIILNALRDRSPHVRRHAIRIAEDRWENRSIRQLVESLVDDPDKHVRYQLALSVGNWKPTFASRTLARLAVRDMANPWIKAAVLSSLPKVSDFVFDAVASTTSDTPGRAAMLADLVGIAAATRHDRLDRMLHPVIPNSTQMDEHDWRLVEKLQDAFDRSRINVNTFMDSFDRASRVTAARLKTIHLKALDTAADPKNSLTLRRSALQMAGRGFNKYDLPRLAGFLDSDQPRELQTDALAAMTRKTSDELAPLLLKNWPTHTPALRQQIITALLRRDTLINGLLDAIEAGTISPGEIDHLTRLRISRRPEEKIIKRAARLIPVQRNTNRAAVVKKYAAALKLNGDPERGKEVFQQQCASCHKLNGIGHHVGPDLAVYRNKNAGDILEAILDPNSVIEPRFTQYEIETKGGETHAGIIQTDSTAGLTLLQAQGVIQQIKRSNIESLRASILSIMPEGLEQAISHSQMSHLMAFLKSR
ncbi:MAG: HEAT repeat domain-containing protein [Limisphaerales bacterium]